MENNYYQIYVDSVRELAASIVIKSVDTAEALNNELMNKYGSSAVNQNDPTTWRYYLNVNGQYHSEDEVMTVVSLDTLETINFTRSNLLLHRGTAKAYTYGSRNYKELVNRYPRQERLILGILYPCDIQKAVDASEGTILSYPTSLVEEHEYSLIANLQEWVYGYSIRWNNTQFKLSDNLYPATMLGIMYLNLVPTILNLRLKACKSNEAHTYHIRQYLASNGMLDVYMNYLTRNQILFLYRNIAYITRNSGKAAVFEWLTEHIMTERGLPLAEYQMRHDLTNQPGQLRPILNFRKHPLNTAYNYDQRDNFTVDDIANKEDYLARDNFKYRDFYQSSMIGTMQNSLSNKQMTKLLESTTIDYSGSEHYTLADTLLYHWMYFSINGSYRTYVGITSPASGETITLRANNALELYVYAYCKSIGVTLTHLPIITAKRVMRTPKPSVSDLMSVVNPSVVPSSFATQMLNLLPLPAVHVSTDSFYNWCFDLHKASMQQYYQVSTEGSSNARGQKYALMSRCWQDADIQLGTPGQTYADWFAALNLNIDGYSQADLQALSTDILIKATGLDSTSGISMKEIQAAMINLMRQLSSYSVQYSVEINSSSIIDTPTTALRPDDINNDINFFDNVPVPIEVVQSFSQQNSLSTYSISSQEFNIDLTVQRAEKFDFEITPKVTESRNEFTHYYRQNMGVDIIIEVPNLTNNTRSLVPVIGIDAFLQLPLTDQLTIPDIWTQ